MWAARGKTYTETAQIIGVAFGSVKTYLDTARYKLNAVNVTHAVAVAYEIGVFERNTVKVLIEDPVFAKVFDWT